MNTDASATQLDETKRKQEELKQRAKKIIGQVYTQLTKGCGKEFCTNKDCASNKVVWKDKTMSEKDALKIAIQFTKTLNTNPNNLKLCSPDIAPKTIQLEELIEFDKLTDEQKLERYIEVFSCPFSLSFSFLKDRDYYLTTDNHNIDFEAVEKYYSQLENIFGEERIVDEYLKT